MSGQWKDEFLVLPWENPNTRNQHSHRYSHRNKIQKKEHEKTIKIILRRRLKSRTMWASNACEPKVSHLRMHPIHANTTSWCKMGLNAAHPHQNRWHWFNFSVTGVSVLVQLNSLNFAWLLYVLTKWCKVCLLWLWYVFKWGNMHFWTVQCFCWLLFWIVFKWNILNCTSW